VKLVEADIARPVEACWRVFTDASTMVSWVKRSAGSSDADDARRALTNRNALRKREKSGRLLGECGTAETRR